MNITADSVVTGGTGFIGRWLVARLTARGRRVAVIARGGVARAAELGRFVDAHGGDASLVHVIAGDLERPGLGLDHTIDGVRDVYHLAGAYRFGMTRTEARSINVDGTLRVAAWARAQPELRRFVELGGYRATVMPSWLANSPHPLPDSVRRRLYRGHGAYEASKYESHVALLRYAETHGLPLTGVHPATVVGDSVTGETSQVTGLGETVEALWRGKLPALAGSPTTFVPVVCVDYLAELMASVPEREETRGAHLCALDPSTPRLPELVRHVADTLGVRAPQRVVSPRLVALLPQAVTGVPREALEFLSEDDYDTRSAEAHARAVGLQMPDVHQALSRWATFLVATEFTRRPDAPVGRFVDVGDSQAGRTYTIGDAITADSVFVHGLPWNADSAGPLADALEVSVAAPDLPGLGRSGGANVDHYAWLEALLAGRDTPALLVAHSLGTAYAVRFAVAHPDRVRALILISPYFLQRRAPWYLRIPAITSRVLRMGSAETLARRLVGDTEAARDGVASAYDSLRRPAVSKRVARELASVSAKAHRRRLVALLAETSVPVLIVHGADDPLVTQPARGELVVISGAGHNPHVTQPGAVAGHINAFTHECRDASGTSRNAERLQTLGRVVEERVDVIRVDGDVRGERDHHAGHR